MFNWLQNKLGITDLQEQIGKVYVGMQFHRQAVTDRLNDVVQRLSDIDDHLLEMKEMVKNHAVVSEQKAMDRHNEVMARLGMVLTEIGKVVPVQTVTSGYMQAFPLEKNITCQTCDETRGRPKKVKGDEQWASR